MVYMALHNMVSNGPIRLVVVNSDQLWSKISSINELVHIKSELRNFGQVYQVTSFEAP